MFKTTKKGENQKCYDITKGITLTQIGIGEVCSFFSFTFYQAFIG
tara:strand:+ start:238 stop:372 length:135 start_codon:yes stop_codon:yes gene_type:complete